MTSRKPSHPASPIESNIQSDMKATIRHPMEDATPLPPTPCPSAPTSAEHPVLLSAVDVRGTSDFDMDGVTDMEDQDELRERLRSWGDDEPVGYDGMGAPLYAHQVEDSA